MWAMVDRRTRELTDNEIAKVADTYHQWKTEWGDYEDVTWYCKSVTLEEVAKHDYVLTPWRYVWVVVDELDDRSFDEKMTELTEQLAKQMKQSKALDAKIADNLASIGYVLPPNPED